MLYKIHGSAFLGFDCLSLVDLSVNPGDGLDVSFIECRIEV